MQSQPWYIFQYLGGRFHTPVLDNTIKATLSKDHTRDTETKGSKKIPYLRIKNLKNRTLFRCTYLYSPYMRVARPPPPGGSLASSFTSAEVLVSVDGSYLLSLI